jgi:hypothetical protein
VNARTASGRTNLRASPDTRSAVVVTLPPGTAVLAQSVGDSWWKVKSGGRAKFEGFIRQDRLVFH